MKAYLALTFKVADANRAAAAAVYSRYKQPFLDDVPGALSKDLLVREEDVQVLHGFESAENAEAYLASRLFQEDVVTAIKPYLDGSPDVRVYEVA